jgi:two-component system, sensor histidine kinase and response regulator
MQNRRSVLVIEDDSGVSQVISAVLEESYNVSCTTSVSEAWNALQQNRPDLVVCDGLLRTVDGYTFTSQLRTNPATATVPVVITSGSPDLASEERARSVGAVAFLAKPFLIEELMKLVDLHAGRGLVSA